MHIAERQTQGVARGEATCLIILPLIGGQTQGVARGEAHCLIILPLLEGKQGVARGEAHCLIIFPLTGGQTQGVARGEAHCLGAGLCPASFPPLTLAAVGGILPTSIDNPL